MLFKLSYTVNRLDIHSRDILEINLDDTESIRCVLRSPTDEEKAKGHQSFNAILDVLGEFEPTKRSFPIFTALIEGRRPPEDQKAISADEMIIREGPSYGLEYYPAPFVSFVDTVRGKLSLISNALVNVIRWRYAQDGPLSPLISQGLGLCFSCSNDAGVSWYPIPGRYSIKKITPPHSIFAIDETDVNEISKLISTNKEQPPYHELLREAKELQHSSPRSSVLLAISAAEVAVKFAIVNRAPDNTWLIDNMQSPPIVKMLIKYLPTLLQEEEQLFYKAEKNSEFIKTFMDGVLIRNEMAHKGTRPPTTEKVLEIIRAVQKLLWICDYYSGCLWAKQHIHLMESECHITNENPMDCFNNR
jgi:hypothetical protein